LARESVYKYMSLKSKEISDEVERIIVERFSTMCKDEDFSFLDVNWLARNMGVSAAYLSRSFKESKGVNLKDFLNGIRIDRSIRLITSNLYLPIREIAKRLDYSCSHFIQAFKIFYGITPGRYRSLFLSPSARLRPRGLSKSSRAKAVDKRLKRPKGAGKCKPAAKKIKPKE
jgi:AraC-like DNA-binding protein